jgi:hypothetical protein
MVSSPHRQVRRIARSGGGERGLLSSAEELLELGTVGWAEHGPGVCTFLKGSFAVVVAHQTLVAANTSRHSRRCPDPARPVKPGGYTLRHPRTPECNAAYSYGWRARRGSTAVLIARSISVRMRPLSGRSPMVTRRRTRVGRMGFALSGLMIVTLVYPATAQAQGCNSPPGPIVNVWVIDAHFTDSFGPARIVEIPAGGGAEQTRERASEGDTDRVDHTWTGAALSLAIDFDHNLLYAVTPSLVRPGLAGVRVLDHALENYPFMLTSTDTANLADLAIAPLNRPSALATDSSGNVFVINTGFDYFTQSTPTQVLEYPDADQDGRGSGDQGVPQLVGAGFVAPSALAVDAAGDLFVADTNRVAEIPKVGPQRDVATGIVNPVGLAIDARGDLFVAEHGIGVMEIPTGGDPRHLVGKALTQVTGVAADPNGDVFATTNERNQVAEIPAGGTSEYWFGRGLSTGLAGVAVEPTQT